MWAANKIKRWWRGRGHGVHSPFAYRFITSVLRLDGRYYASSELEGMPDARWHLLIFRLVCEFEPTRVESANVTDDLCKAVSLADSRVDIDTGGSRAVIIYGRDCRVTVFRDIHMMMSDWNIACYNLSAGMTFTDGTMGVVVERPDLPRQHFEIDFRL